jgi:hypothetical protein
MKRKVYDSDHERKRDRRIGFLVFPALNVVLWGGLGIVSPLAPRGSQLLNVLLLVPWIVNGVVLAWALIFRPYVAVGYLACLATIIIGSLALGLVFIGSCLIALATAMAIGPLAVLVFLALFGGGIVLLGKLAVLTFEGWWSE